VSGSDSLGAHNEAKSTGTAAVRETPLVPTESRRPAAMVTVVCHRSWWRGTSSPALAGPRRRITAGAGAWGAAPLTPASDELRERRPARHGRPQSPEQCRREAAAGPYGWGSSGPGVCGDGREMLAFDAEWRHGRQPTGCVMRAPVVRSGVTVVQRWRVGPAAEPGPLSVGPSARNQGGGNGAPASGS
jgi:hypothetical protein